MTKWIIKDLSPLALSVYGGIYLVVQMCIFGLLLLVIMIKFIKKQFGKQLWLEH